jgi:hypothetical protein
VNPARGGLDVGTGLVTVVGLIAIAVLVGVLSVQQRSSKAP